VYQYSDPDLSDSDLKFLGGYIEDASAELALKEILHLDILPEISPFFQWLYLHKHKSI
jgi:hypothetical protein